MVFCRCPLSLFSLLAILVLDARADTVQRPQAWSILRYNHDLSDDESLGAQAQNRYDFRSNLGFEEQFNFFYDRPLWGQPVTFILTLGSTKGYQRLSELRYALQGGRNYTVNSRWQYNWRLRHELRDFRSGEPIAHRFRIRNEVSRSLTSQWIDELSLSGEFNFYLNKVMSQRQGLSSYRTILGGTWEASWGTWGLAYLNDFRWQPNGKEIRHVLVWSMLYGE